jgi:orotate phosphoribosyltransferase
VTRMRVWNERGSMERDLPSLVHGRTGHFLLESGHHVDLWFGLETLCQRSREIKEFVAGLAARLAPYKVGAVVVQWWWDVY